MTRSGFLLLSAVAVGAGTFVSFLAQPARAAVTEQEVRQMIEKTYEVKVLKLVADRLDGRPVFLVTVMSAAGNDNGAFQVNRLAVDAETGKLVSAFRHHTSGYELPAGARDSEPDRQPTDVLRQGWNWR